jgi:hypothetical protein
MYRGGGLEIDDYGYGLEHIGESLVSRPTSEDDSKALPLMGVVEIEEVEDFPFMKEMALALEVNSVTGLNYDGQAGLQ